MTAPWWESDEECDRLLEHEIGTVLCRDINEQRRVICAAAERAIESYGHAPRCVCHESEDNEQTCTWLVGLTHEHPYQDARCLPAKEPHCPSRCTGTRVRPGIIFVSEDNPILCADKYHDVSPRTESKGGGDDVQR